MRTPRAKHSIAIITLKGQWKTAKLNKSDMYVYYVHCHMVESNCQTADSTAFVCISIESELPQSAHHKKTREIKKKIGQFMS